MRDFLALCKLRVGRCNEAEAPMFINCFDSLDRHAALLSAESDCIPVPAVFDTVLAASVYCIPVEFSIPLSHRDRKKFLESLYFAISDDDLIKAVDMRKFGVGETEIQVKK